MTNNEKRLIGAAKDVHRTAKLVNDWMNEEGRKGNLRTNGDAPMWNEYMEAKTELYEAIEEVGKERGSDEIL